MVVNKVAVPILDWNAIGDIWLQSVGGMQWLKFSWNLYGCTVSLVLRMFDGI